MAKLKISTDAAVVAANNIKSCNTQMRDKFSTMQNAITKLDSSWDGSAATATISKFNEIKANYHEARYNVLDNYVNFLLSQVDEGYTQTENANISLAERFK